MKPGLIQTYTLKKVNTFVIEITDEISELLILKGITDGHNLNLCA